MIRKIVCWPRHGAKSSIDLTMYELADQTAENDLAAAARRGVDVRVILDSHLERSSNTAAYDFLAAHRVHVTWAPSGTTYHQKTLTVDGRTSAIMTLNLVSEDYPGTRDFAVIDTGKADVAAIVTTFNADFAPRPVTPPDGSDLVWSPTNSQAAILAVIDSARRTLAVENEEMDDPVITKALEAAAKRGVDVKITMTAEISGPLVVRMPSSLLYFRLAAEKFSEPTNICSPASPASATTALAWM